MVMILRYISAEVFRGIFMRATLEMVLKEGYSLRALKTIILEHLTWFAISLYVFPAWRRSKMELHRAGVQLLLFLITKLEYNILLYFKQQLWKKYLPESNNIIIKNSHRMQLCYFK